MFSNDSGKSINDNLVQPLNVIGPIVVTVFGIIICGRLEQSWNAFDPIVFNELSINEKVTVFNLWQSWNAFDPIDDKSTQYCISTKFKLLQLLNVSLLIVVTTEPIVTELRSFIEIFEF